MINDTLQNRRYVIVIIISVIVFIYIARLFSLQIIEEKYKKGADSNAFLHKTQYAPRGLIYDRNQNLLVYNKPAYDVMLIMREIKQLDTISLCKDLNITPEYFNDRIAEIRDSKKNRGYSDYTPQLFMSQLSTEDIATIQQFNKYPGFYIQNRTLREYTYTVAAHLLGSIGEVSPRMIEKDNYYKRGDYAGRDGVEYTYEKQLRGEKGVEILLRDVKGRIKGKYENGEMDIAPKAGTNLTLTIDVELQLLAEKLLNGKIGSVVAIEPATGEILVMAANPTFDPAVLVGRQRSENYNNLANDPTKPLLNRATQAQYPPGSTAKPMQALIALQLGGITEHSMFPCNGKTSQPFRCSHPHGSPVSLYNAIEQSCNPYFWYVFRATVDKNGYGEGNLKFRDAYCEWESAVRSFGLGSRFSDGDIYEQSSGLIPDTTFYDKRFLRKTGWRSTTIRSLAIGQGEMLATPLQLANMTAAIANDGYYITPHINKTDSMKQKIHEIDIDKEYFRIVKEAMLRVTEFGTAKNAKIAGITVCGKTGTAENSHGKDHALFIAFAPKDNPQIAIAVAIENVGFGSTWASPIASLLIEQYLTEKIERTWMLDNMLNAILNPDVKRF